MCAGGFQTTYGYEWQGDNLLIARENMVASFVDYYMERFGRKPEKKLVMGMAKIVSWNLWQMDGLTYQIPQKKDEAKPKGELTLFGEAPAELPLPLCKIKDWQTGKSVKVIDIKLRETKNRNIMKFDVIIGNPPYQEETESDSTRKQPIFNFFMDEAYKISKRVSLITPARFLFKAGYTKRTWDEKMLNDEHLKVQYYESVSANVFKNTDIKGVLLSLIMILIKNSIQ